MLAEITAQLRDSLTTRGVPFAVVYGPERLTQGSSVSPHIVVERDRERGDTLRPPRTHRQNPHNDHVRAIGARCRVYAHSTQPGAQSADHERIADQIVDHVVVALRAIVAARKTEWRLSSAKLLSASELAEEGLTYAGSVYELRFAIDRGVSDVTFAGETSTGTEPTTATAGGVGGFTVAGTVDLTSSPEPTTDLPGASTR